MKDSIDGETFCYSDFYTLDQERRAVREESLNQGPCKTMKEEVGGGARLLMTYTDSYSHSTMASGGVWEL